MFKFKLGQVVHQGDVFITKVSDAIQEIAGEEIKPEETGLVLQHGEALGHYHRVENPAVATLKLTSLDNAVKKMMLTIKEETKVNHEEHGSIVLTPGTYEVRTQREQRNGLNRAVID